MTPRPAPLACLLLSLAAAAEPEHVGPPLRPAHIGDSISVGMSTSWDPTAWPRNTWCSGSNSTVQSHLLRLRALDVGLTVEATNVAVEGEGVANTATQVPGAIAAGPDYVTFMLGANDACADSEAGMMDPFVFEAYVRAALTRLSEELPDARLYVISIPNLYQLWRLFRDDAGARFVWWSVGICQSMLANAESSAAEDVARRDRVRRRVEEYNRILGETCARFIHCRYDGGAVYSTAFTTAEVSDIDFFHPSVAGQTRLAAVTWAAGFDFTDVTAPTTTHEVGRHGDQVALLLSGTDDAGLAGIEYRSGAGQWLRYDGPVLLDLGQTVTYRGVDVNGNIEASKDFTATELPPLAEGGCACGSAAGGPPLALVAGLLWVLAASVRRRRHAQLAHQLRQHLRVRQ